MKWSIEKTKGSIRSISARISGCQVVIHHHIDFSPDDWFLSVNGWLTISRRPLRAKDVEGAKEEGLAHIRGLCKKMLREVGKS